MIISRRGTLALSGAALCAPFLSSGVLAAAVHDVQMVNNHPEDDTKLMAFYPEVVRAQPGDTIRFLSVDNNHNTEAFKNMLPEGADHWRSKLGEDFELTVDVDGAYGYFCTPHKTWGMVGLLLVGDVSVNYDALKSVRQRGKARARFEELFALADTMLTADA
ncbi:MAG: pseudoazurin [Pseudomonadota bacterium]